MKHAVEPNNSEGTPEQKTSYPLKRKVLIITLAALTLPLAVIAVVLLKNSTGTHEQISCTADAMICSDGTAVGRTGPNCEFTPCPTSAPENTANWEIYKDEEYGFEFKYPPGFNLNLYDNVESPTLIGINVSQTEPYADITIYISSGSAKPTPQNSDNHLNSKIIIIANQQVTKYFGYSGIGGSVYTEEVNFSHNGLNYDIQFGTYEQKNMLDQILSTFKFVE